MAVALAAGCQTAEPPPAAPPEFAVTQTVLAPDAGPAAPALTVTRPAAALTRDDWAIAEAALRDHCAGQGAALEILPATTAYTQVQYDEGVWTFVARCAL